MLGAQVVGDVHLKYQAHTSNSRLVLLDHLSTMIYESSMRFSHDTILLC